MAHTTALGADKLQPPRGFLPIGVFFIFGATVSAYAAVTLLRPGTALDGLWSLNQAGHTQLLSLGRPAGLGFIALSAALSASAIGWLLRHRWGWILGATIIALNLTGDLINSAMGDWRKGAVGVSIAGLLLLYMSKRGVRNYFRHG